VASEETMNVLPTYGRYDVTLTQGDGVWLTDPDGKRYLDFVAGIAVVALGHCHPAVTSAAHAQLDRLWHTSNLYWTEPMTDLATRISSRIGGGQTFFCNSGAESIEAGLKYARKATGKSGVIALDQSFHGRTYGALSATGQPTKHAGFGPMLPDMRFAQLNDAESLAAAAADGNVACILLEIIQGEGGINPASKDFVASTAELARNVGALLFVDEIQTGVGRTGSYFAFEQLGIKPDLVALAKGLANGLPIGALVVSNDAPRGLEPGDHGSTFGGNLTACAAACAVDDAITPAVLENVAARGGQLREGLQSLPGVVEVRGRGLLIGCELDQPAAPVIAECIERGLLLCPAGENVLRLTPPLIIEAEHAEQAIATLWEVLT